MNCYEAMKRIIEIDSKMSDLGKLLASAKNPADKNRYEKNIDVLEMEFLKLKHQLEVTELNTNILL
jgi:TATA-binding protein-associated factor Taf7